MARTLLSINNYYYRRGGAETVFLEQNKLFENAGWRVVPFSMLHDKNLRTPWSNYFIDELEFGSDYSWWKKTSMIPKVIFSFEARRKLESLLKIVSPDICHLHNIYHHISPSILGVLSQHEIPTVLSLHDLKIACPAYSMLNKNGVCERCRGGNLRHVLQYRCIKGSFALSALIYIESSLHRILRTYEKYVDRFVAPSHFYRNKLIEWGWDPEKIVHVPNFVNVDVMEPAERVGRSFLYFGRLSPEKGLVTLIKAAKISGIKLQIVGSGPMQEQLASMAKAIGSDVDFLGYLSGNELHDAIRLSRAVILPSEWYENAPMSIMEAYALGKPVIGARIGGIPELVIEGETGITFASGSETELADSINNILDLNDNEVSRMGATGRDWMRNEYSGLKYRERMTELYGNILALRSAKSNLS